MYINTLNYYAYIMAMIKVVVSVLNALLCNVYALMHCCLTTNQYFRQSKYSVCTQISVATYRFRSLVLVPVSGAMQNYSHKLVTLENYGHITG